MGREAASWSAWLHRELVHGIPMMFLETHHTARLLEAQRNQTDKNDAHGLAQLVRSGSALVTDDPLFVGTTECLLRCWAAVDRL